MAEKPEPILNLRTFTEHYSVAIDGTEYDLVNPDEMSIVAFHRLAERTNAVQKLRDREDLSDGDLRYLAESLREVTGLILSTAPADVLDALSDSQRLRILMVFTRLLAGKLPDDGAEESPTDPSTGARS